MATVPSIVPDATALAQLAAAAGPGNATSDPDRLAPLLSDWRGRYHGQTPLLLEPRTTQQVVAIVQAAAAHRVALVPQGGNTGLVGGGVPPADGSAVLLSTRRLNRIRQVDADGLTLVAEAGVVLSHVHDAAAAVGAVFPLSLGARGSATIGGLAATNAGGVQVLRHGTMRALVAGLEAVLPDGTLLNQLSGLVKDNTGYDIKQLLIGSEGTLGVITAVALKLVPAPRHRTVAWAGLASPAAALALLVRLRALSGGQVESFELIPGSGVALVAEQFPALRPPLAGVHPWHVLMELAGPAPLEDVVAEALLGHCDDAVIAASDTQAAQLWRIREDLPLAERQSGLAVHHDISVPVAAVPAFAASATAAVESAFPGAAVLAFGHLGDGNLHFNVRANVADAKGFISQHGAAITALVNQLVTAAGGSISAEHGIGAMKRDALALLADPGKLAAMRAVKQALDPLGIMNPGRIL